MNPTFQARFHSFSPSGNLLYQFLHIVLLPQFDFAFYPPGWRLPVSSLICRQEKIFFCAKNLSTDKNPQIMIRNIFIKKNCQQNLKLFWDRMKMNLIRNSVKKTIDPPHCLKYIPLPGVRLWIMMMAAGLSRTVLKQKMICIIHFIAIFSMLITNYIKKHEFQILFSNMLL